MSEEMIDADPILLIRDLIDENFENETPYDGSIDVHTGWYGEDATDPQITVTNPEEFTFGGGDTQNSAGTGTGGKVQVRGGDILVNCWGGVRNSTGVNPRKQSFQMRNEVHKIIQRNSIPELNSIGTGPIRGFPDPDHPPGFTQRYELRVRYTYIS